MLCNDCLYCLNVFSLTFLGKQIHQRALLIFINFLFVLKMCLARLFKISACILVCNLFIFRLFFVIEFVNGGDLMFHMQRQRRLPEEHARFYSAEIVLALNYLHQRGKIIVHIKFKSISVMISCILFDTVLKLLTGHHICFLEIIC